LRLPAVFEKSARRDLTCFSGRSQFFLELAAGSYERASRMKTKMILVQFLGQKNVNLTVAGSLSARIIASRSRFGARG
jgi:hypothetical protein